MNVVVTGVGHNLASMRFALARLGVEAVFTNDPILLARADRVIVPGVGTAGCAMANLQRAGLVELLPKLTVPVLGVCIGMQILLTHCAEDNVQTLNIIPGTVERLRTSQESPVPNMGWSQLRHIDRSSKLLQGVDENSYLYFVHSYALGQSNYAIAQSQHRESFTAAVGKDNFYGVQFHPERSGEVGAKILKNFFMI